MNIADLDFISLHKEAIDHANLNRAGFFMESIEWVEKFYTDRGLVRTEIEPILITIETAINPPRVKGRIFRTWWSYIRFAED